MRSIYAQAKRQGSLWKVCSSQVSSARSHKNSWERSFHWQGNNHNKQQFKERKGAKKWWFAADLLQNAQETNVLRRKSSLKSQSGLRGRGRDKKVRWNKGKERAISWFWEYKSGEPKKKKGKNGGFQLQWNNWAVQHHNNNNNNNNTLSSPMKIMKRKR